jgi:protein tyrosine phosphatase (PTP) superfamily phosphohydrolase (DUF442 family)
MAVPQQPALPDVDVPPPDLGWFGLLCQDIFAFTRWLGGHSPRLQMLTHRYIAYWQRLSGRASVDNFGQVTPWLFRGGQPGPAAFATLHQLGIRTVVNLTAEAERDQAWAEAAGMRVVYIPLAPFGPPTLAEAELFLATIRDPEGGPYFVHCFHGSDRTGAMVACYRMAVEGWSPEQAFAEMQLFGFHPRSQDAKRQFVWEYGAYLAAAQASDGQKVFLAAKSEPT